MIRFSQVRKNAQLQVSKAGKRVAVDASGSWYRNILGEEPLLPGNVYTWKLRFEGDDKHIVVGVIDESKFGSDVCCYAKAHTFHSCGGHVFGGLSGNKAQWNRDEELEITANLIDETLTIQSLSSSSIDLSGPLPKLNNGNYYPYFFMRNSDQVLEIVE
ncbi:hypothetical protein GEMRC1_004136 [Eukaryota sp. GEM-RC1]